MSIDVFVSVGRTSTPDQEQFVSAIEHYLQINGLSPKAVGRNAFSATQPLELIDQLMQECSGTVVIAFERIFIERGVERRGSIAPAELEQCSLPTVWNQIETAMAYSHRHPLLVVMQQGLRNEGLLESGFDWWIQQVPMTEEALHVAEFIGVFTDWKHRVESFHDQKIAEPAQDERVKPDKVSIRQLIGSLTMGQVFGLLAGVVGIVAGIVSIIVAFR